MSYGGEREAARLRATLPPLPYAQMVEAARFTPEEIARFWFAGRPRLWRRVRCRLFGHRFTEIMDAVYLCRWCVRVP